MCLGCGQFADGQMFSDAMNEFEPVLERCRNGGVIRWARGWLVAAQYLPLQPRLLDMICLVRSGSLRRQQQFRQKSPLLAPDPAGAGRPAGFIVANRGRRHD